MEPTGEIRLVDLDRAAWSTHGDRVMVLEAEAYEPGRREERAAFERMVADPRGVGLAALSGEDLAGFGFGGPLEGFAGVGGVRVDPRFGQADTLYVADIAVAMAYRGQGVGRALKEGILVRARSLGYRCLAGRNRVGSADAMWRLNVQLGAREIARIADAYPDGPAPREARYYHLTL